MTLSELQSLLPKDKLDHDNLTKLLTLGYPAMAPVVPTLIDWCLDINWPVAHDILPFFEKIGDPIANHLAEYLLVNDTHLADKADALGNLFNAKWSHEAVQPKLIPAIEELMQKSLAALGDPTSPEGKESLFHNQGPSIRSDHIAFLACATRVLSTLNSGEPTLIDRAISTLLRAPEAGYTIDELYDQLCRFPRERILPLGNLISQALDKLEIAESMQLLALCVEKRIPLPALSTSAPSEIAKTNSSVKSVGSTNEEIPYSTVINSLQPYLDRIESKASTKYETALARVYEYHWHHQRWFPGESPLAECDSWNWVFCQSLDTSTPGTPPLLMASTSDGNADTVQAAVRAQLPEARALLTEILDGGTFNTFTQKHPIVFESARGLLEHLVDVFSFSGTLKAITGKQFPTQAPETLGIPRIQLPPDSAYVDNDNVDQSEHTHIPAVSGPSAQSINRDLYARLHTAANEADATTRAKLFADLRNLPPESLRETIEDYLLRVTTPQLPQDEQSIHDYASFRVALADAIAEVEQTTFPENHAEPERPYKVVAAGGGVRQNRTPQEDRDEIIADLKKLEEWTRDSQQRPTNAQLSTLTLQTLYYYASDYRRELDRRVLNRLCSYITYQWPDHRYRPGSPENIPSEAAKSRVLTELVVHWPREKVIPLIDALSLLTDIDPHNHRQYRSRDDEAHEQNPAIQAFFILAKHGLGDPQLTITAATYYLSAINASADQHLKILRDILPSWPRARFLKILSDYDHSSWHTQSQRTDIALHALNLRINKNLASREKLLRDLTWNQSRNAYNLARTRSRLLEIQRHRAYWRKLADIEAGGRLLQSFLSKSDPLLDYYSTSWANIYPDLSGTSGEASFPDQPTWENTMPPDFWDKWAETVEGLKTWCAQRKLQLIFSAEACVRFDFKYDDQPDPVSLPQDESLQSEPDTDFAGADSNCVLSTANWSLSFIEGRPVHKLIFPDVRTQGDTTQVFNSDQIDEENHRPYPSTAGLNAFFSHLAVGGSLEEWQNTHPSVPEKYPRAVLQHLILLLGPRHQAWSIWDGHKGADDRF